MNLFGASDLAPFEQLSALLLSLRAEICLFLVAVAVHLLLFRLPRGSVPRKASVSTKKAKVASADDGDTAILLEIEASLQRHLGQEERMRAVNDLLSVLSRRQDFDFADKVVRLLPAVGLQPDSQTYEILLNMQFMSRNYQSVARIVGRMKAEGVPFTTRSSVILLKVALKQDKFAEAKIHFRELSAVISKRVGEATSSPSAAPKNIILQMVECACLDRQLENLLPELTGMPLTEEVIQLMLSECLRCKDQALAQKVEKLARDQKFPLSDAMYALLVRNLANEPRLVEEIYAEVLERGSMMSPELVLAFLSFCSLTGLASFADKLFENCHPTQPAVLSHFIRFYAENHQYEKACDLYEKHSRSLGTDLKLERSVMNASMSCGRTELAKRLLDSGPSDVSKHIAMMRNCAASKNLQGVFAVFQALQDTGGDISSVVYNTVLDACVECHDMRAAEEWMEKTKLAGHLDVVTYNTMIKAHLHSGNFEKARALMEEMAAAGLQPNRVTFNELVNALVGKGGAGGQKKIWGIIDEMQAVGMRPNQVTCSILLKALDVRSAPEDVEKTMGLIRSMEEPMDEVLLSSVVEACVRIGKPEFLSMKLKELHANDKVKICGSHTFGSLIKAYGFAKDVAGVWSCWGEMRSRHIRPTSITLGCMVEAVVHNGDTEGGYELIHQMQEDENCRSALNSVIYCSVLKGFAREKNLERVFAVYKEMQERQLDFSTVTYNTIIDACARCGRVDYLPAILEDMQKNRIRPNVITFSTMLKGHCQTGDIQKGFAILEQMKKEAGLKPDEIMYNSLLDGCAQHAHIDEGLRVLQQMQEDGVKPSNYTLSILVKLMGRARRLDAAFDLMKQVARKFSISPNVHVYTNLIQACIGNRQLQRALETLELMIKEQVQPESRTYAILLRASLSHGLYDQAEGLLRAALGLKEAAPAFLRTPVASCPSLDEAVVNEMLIQLSKTREGPTIDLISEIKACRPRVRIDAATVRRVMAPGLRQATKGAWPLHLPANRQQSRANDRDRPLNSR
eukprot:CAMPEP_0170640568 /NCGR_PEP_ID=MMETSP0224-20130122/40296_1 /TAXON_ID=285029 /ORGANISM="Togula jolla, Strain CCCM 725" /LENGTH=1023 /DNA_ID=CAMNT_0010971087 /DNA_START=103 /DNA_END=3174 /DNA_ORIENTATION=+